jgi:hypothetical protein
MVLLILTGVIFHFSWTNWNQGADLHPDEYGLTSTLTALRLPDSLSEYFNTRISPISPYQKYDLAGQPTDPGPDNRMRWGQWPIILIRAAAEWTGNTGYTELRLMGRQLSALVDVLALIVLFLIGKRLYGERAGLLAAALGSLAVLQIQQSHFMTADNFGVLFCVLALYCAARTVRLPDLEEAPGAVWHWYALFGVFLGMAVATKINLVVLAGVIVLAALLELHEITGGFRWRALTPWLRAFLLLVLAASFSLITFRICQPMSFRAPTGDTSLLTLHLNQDWSDSMEVAQNESKGVNAGPPGEQWIDRPTLIFPLVNMVVWGMGLPLGLAAWVGFVWALWQIFRTRDGWQAHVLPVAWVGAYFLFMGTRHVMSMRYFLPIYPFLCLLAAAALLDWYDRVLVARRRGLLPALAAGVVLLGTFAWAVGFVKAVYMQPNTRIQATRWILENVTAPFHLELRTLGVITHQPVAAPDPLLLNPGENYTAGFDARQSTILTGIDVAHLRSQSGDAPADWIRVTISTDPGGQQILAQAQLPVLPVASDLRGEPSFADFPPIALIAGQTYYLTATAGNNPAVVQRPVLANEHWDESLPVRLDGYDPFGQFYTGLSMDVRWPDDDNKRQMYINNLAQTDYLILPSQRSLWSISRLPENYPMTMEYYRALMSGELGFDLVAQFQAPIQFGPLYISDLAGSAAWGQPPELPRVNNNLLAAEEAFTIYDHAPVWIYKKRADFQISRVMDFFNGLSLAAAGQ